jgi:hypothetical protein
MRQHVPEIGSRQHPLSRQQEELAAGAHASPRIVSLIKNLTNFVPSASVHAGVLTTQSKPIAIERLDDNACIIAIMGSPNDPRFSRHCSCL